LVFRHRQFALFSSKTSVTVHLNMSERENWHLPLAKQTVRSRIASERWDQIKTAYASGIGLREIARNMNIPEGTILSRAKREGLVKANQPCEIARETRGHSAFTPMEAVALTLNERKDKTKLHLSCYAVGSERKAANHGQKLKIARQVKDVAAVAESVWPAEKQEGPSVLVNIALLGIDPRTVAVRDTDAEG
jgi:DNA-binding transcriptional regulator LsrR (DeoR family)